MLGRMIPRSITAVMMAEANLIRPPKKLLSLLQAGYNVIARMIPHITGEIKGLRIVKQSAIKRAMTPSFIKIPPADGSIFLGVPLY
jgi:hypothetical protein